MVSQNIQLTRSMKHTPICMSCQQKIVEIVSELESIRKASDTNESWVHFCMSSSYLTHFQVVSLIARSPTRKNSKCMHRMEAFRTILTTGI